MARERTKDDLRLGAGFAGLAAVVFAGLAAFLPFSEEGRALSNGNRVALAAVPLVLAVGLACLAFWSFRKIASAPHEAPPVDDETRKQAAATALALVVLQGVLMVVLAVYGFSSGNSFVAYGGTVAALLFAYVGIKLLRIRRRAGRT